MQYIQRDKLVHIEWSIFRGTSQVPEDFSRALVKMFLVGGNEKYLLTATAEGGKLLADLPGDLPEGAYSLEAIWVKNYGNLLPHRQPLTPGGEPVCPRRPGPHPNDPCFIHPHDHRFNDRCLMRSRKDYVFALTEYPGEETVTGESGEVTVRLASAVATYGYDGLSAYQIAVMRGDFSGTEGEFLAQSGFTKLKTINGESLIGEGDIQITGGGTLETATETKLGGIRAATKTQDETVEVKIDPVTGKLYVPAAEVEALEVATENKLGGIKASAKTDNETVEAKIGSDGKLYVPKGGEELKTATETTLGGIKASAKTNNETVEAKIGPDGKLYVPASQDEELKTATETTLGGIRAATKTSLETQEVKIDPATGKLYTQPGGEGGVEIVNNPDEEDLHSIEKSTDVHVLQFADKEYNASAFSGLGRVYLRKNLSGGKNILTQAMMSKANTRYIIQYDYDLDGETIEVPEGCTLDFQGGSLGNGTLSGNHTYIQGGNPGIFKSNLSISGSFDNAEVDLSYFQSMGIDVVSNLIVDIVSCFPNLSRLKFPEKATVKVNSTITINRTGKTIIIDGNNATLKGEGTSPFYYLNITSDTTVIENLNIDNSTCDGDYWSASSISSMKLFRGINNNSNIVVLRNLKISHIWGYAINTYCSFFADISNIEMNDVGGKGKDVSIDSFGDAIYCALKTGNEIINITNVRSVGKVNGETNSRIGICCEALSGIEDENGVLHLNIVNCDFKNFNRSIHLENILNSRCYVTIDNSSFEHCGIHFWCYNDTYDIFSAKNSRFVCNLNNFEGNAGLCRWIKELHLDNCYVYTRYSHTIYGEIKTTISNSELHIQDILCYQMGDTPCHISNSSIKFNQDGASILNSSNNVTLDNCELSKDTDTIKRLSTFFAKATRCTFNSIYPNSLDVENIRNNRFNLAYRGDISNEDYYNSGDNIIYANGVLVCDGSNSLNPLWKSGRIIKRDVTVATDLVPYNNNRIYGINTKMFLVIIPYASSGASNFHPISAILEGSRYYVVSLKTTDIQYEPLHDPIEFGTAHMSIGASFNYTNNIVTPFEGCAFAVMLLSPHEIELLPDGDKLRNMVYKNNGTPYYISIEDDDSVSATAFTTVETT